MNNIVVSATDVNNSLTEYENNMLAYVSAFGLPTENILVPINERRKVIKNLMKW